MCEKYLTLSQSVRPERESLSAYQPIFDALQIPAFDFFQIDKPIIILEGIYDKYAVESLLETGDKFNIFPCVNANSIVKSIQYMIGFLKKYIAIWDNDVEGRKEYEHARKIFGDKESVKFDLLPLLSSKKRRMEDMFEKIDLDMLKLELGLLKDASYETIMSQLFFTKKANRRSVVAKLSQPTRDRFNVLEQIINKRFSIKESE
jgi:hypothetical protein